MFVSKHGGQSEIVLRVKQGDNPTFGFLMPDHHLHAYFRFLVDHQELLQSDTDGKSENEKKGNTEYNQMDGVGAGAGAGALSLLGSVYGSGEDEDASESKVNVSGKTFDASGATVCHGSEKTQLSENVDGKDEAVAKHLSPSKEKVQVLKRNSFKSASKAGTTNSVKKGDSISLISAAVDESQSSALPNASKVEPLVLEPPSDLKRFVEKIVEFILKNGKQFEAVLIEQDSKYGRFPFLVPSNQYHPYYVKVLQQAQELKVTGKSFFSEKDDSVMHRQDKKSSLSKESDSLSLGSASSDMPYDSDRKEKFRMVIGKSKKDGPDPSSKATLPQFGVSVDAAAAAAILQAATRGIKYPNLGILSSTSLNGESHGRNSETGQPSSLGTDISSHLENVIQKSEQKGDQSVLVPIAKAIAKTAAIEVANEADSSEAHMTREQKQKAERLKRAKMFVAMLKTGAAPYKSEPLRSLSVEPQESGVSGSGDKVVNLSGKEREGSSVPLDVDTMDKKERFEKKYSDDEYNERKSRRKYRSRSTRHEEDIDEDEEEKDRKHSKKGKEEDKEDKDHRHSRKKHRLYHSSHEEEDDEEDKRDDEELKEGDDPEGEDSDGSRSSDDPAKLSEWLFVQLPALRTYVQCPICLGIIKKTRTVMECLHRFCRECIDKSMRMGNNECPACRTHCASRRSLRDDPRFDALIDILYDDIEKYEEEELAFHEEEKTRNKQIQASIAQIFRRQSEALITKRKTGKDIESTSGSRLPRKYSRRRRNTRGTEREGSDDNEDENNHDANKDSSSTDERSTEIKQRRYKRKAGAQSSQPSPSAANSDGGGNENDLEASRESKGTSGLVRSAEMLAWGGGGARSKSVRNTRIMKLTKYLENAKENDELDVHLMLISLDKQSTGSSKQLHLCCRPCFSVKSLKEYVSRETQSQAEDIEILMKKDLSTNGLRSTLDPSTSTENKDVLQNLEGCETLAGLGANCAQDKSHLILAYRLKERD
ncbi:splicing factor, suppressor of white-apricot homolog isoform X2 [Camellia sinensis]|nr:splicing factor, suppressor of white-apricot homolog isoform X2 [Camellia sinensis]XP_028069436.1 splicing factor, suppressor of white-apricot homolog isoform X2 [Camellia sinensis]XP_028069437.1 splicing factor, suppressor of white-apricot homolog isoform X2 [Camellia sinensis]